MKGIIEVVKLLVYPIFAYLEIPIEAFLFLVGFMCADSVLGAISSVRMGYKFDFKKLMWGFILKLCFLVIPLMIASLGKSLRYDFEIVLILTMKVLTVSEAYSCLGNIYSAKNKIKVEKMDIVSMLLKSLRKMLKNNIQKILKKIEDSGDCSKN